jgi:hypothetical protein
MEAQDTGHRRPAKTMAERLRRLWRQPPDGTLEARVAHLEAELEGLQDAVYRRAVVEDEQMHELRRRTEPEQVARDLSEDARRRGL